MATTDISPELQEDLVRRAIAACQELDPEWTAANEFYIKDKNGIIRPMGRLKLAQRKVLAAIRMMRDRGDPVRLIIGKSRKQGVSTIIAHDAMMQVWQRGIDALIVSHDKTSAHKIFSIYQRFYQHYGLEKPALYKGKTNMRQILFDNWDGRVEVDTANNIYAGTSTTPQYLHCSEGSKWEHGEETKKSLLQAIGDGPGTTLIWESTFNGHEKTFLPLWRGAYDNCRVWFTEEKIPDNYPGTLMRCHMEVTNSKDWNGYVPIFISVLEDEDARKEFYDDEEKRRFEQTLDDYERSLVANQQAPLETLNWIRFIKKHKCDNDEDTRRQEYPVTAAEAIVASGRPRFSISKLMSHSIEQGQRGRLVESDHWDRHLLWKPDPQGEITRFRPPVPGHRYSVGADTAEGPAEKGARDEDEDDRSHLADKTVFIVLDKDAGGEQVASFQGKITPEEAFPILLFMARYYNDAFVVIESNGQGHSLCLKFNESDYPKHLLYHRDDWKQDGSQKREIGHRTTQGNRNDIISLLADAINDNEVILHDERTIEECKSFVYKEKGSKWRIEAATGEHDDHVFALIMANLGLPHCNRREKFEQMFSGREWQERIAAARKTADSVTGY